MSAVAGDLAASAAVHPPRFERVARAACGAASAAWLPPPVVSYARGAARASSRLGQATAAAAAAAAELAGSGPSPPADEGVVSVIMIADARSCLTAVPLLLELVDR